MVIMGKVELAGKGAAGLNSPPQRTHLRPGWAAELWHRMLSQERVSGSSDLSFLLDPSL